MTVDELRTLLLAFPAEMPVLLSASDPSQGVVIYGTLQRVSVNVSEGLLAGPGLVLETVMPATLRAPPPDDPEVLSEFQRELDETLSKCRLRLVRVSREPTQEPKDKVP